MEVTSALSLSNLQRDFSGEPCHRGGKTWWVATSLFPRLEKVSLCCGSVGSLKGQFFWCRLSCFPVTSGPLHVLPHLPLTHSQPSLVPERRCPNVTQGKRQNLQGHLINPLLFLVGSMGITIPSQIFPFLFFNFFFFSKFFFWNKPLIGAEQLFCCCLFV